MCRRLVGSLTKESRVQRSEIRQEELVEEILPTEDEDLRI